MAKSYPHLKNQPVVNMSYVPYLHAGKGTVNMFFCVESQS